MKTNRIVKYIFITFLISWSCWGLLIILIHNNVTIPDPFGSIVLGIGCLGPAIASIIVQEKRTPKSIMKFVFSGEHRNIPYFFLFCFLLFAGGFIFSQGTSGSLYLLPLLLLVSLGAGLEELGWRGILQPELEKIIPFPIAVLLTGIVRHLII